jgi:hypothetical protein
MTEEGKSLKTKAGISLLPWKTQRTRFPHSHCPTTAANLSSEAKKQRTTPKPERSTPPPSLQLQAHSSVGKD